MLIFFLLILHLFYTLFDLINKTSFIPSSLFIKWTRLYFRLAFNVFHWQAQPWSSPRELNCLVLSGLATNSHLFLFNHFKDMRTTISLSISCRKNMFLLKFSNKNTFFPHEMDKLTVVLMSIKRLNKERRPLTLNYLLSLTYYTLR